MGLDEYILGLLAIISGLAISEMIGGLHTILFHRHRIQWDWLTPLTALYVAYLILTSWWLSWLSFHGLADSMMLGRFLVPVAQLVCLFLAARGILAVEIPDRRAEKIDLSAQYFSVKRYVWGAMAAASTLVIVARLLFVVSPIARVGSVGTRGALVELPMLIFGLMYYLALAFIDNRLFHRIAVPLALVIFVTLSVGSVIRA